MDHTMIPDPPGFAELSPLEQWRYVEALWDRIAAHPETLPVPARHLEVVEERIAAFRANPYEMESMDKVLDDVLDELKTPPR